MKKTLLFAAALTLTACGAKPAEKPAERPDVAKVGELAPQLKLAKILRGDLKSVNGWEDLKGKAVVLEFWGTYCDPCVENIPHLNDLAEKFKDKPVVFLSVTKEPSAKVEEFLKDHEMKGAVAAEADEAFKSFRVNGVPKTVLIGRDGRVAAITYPTEVSAGKLERLLAGDKVDGVSAASLQAGFEESEVYFSMAPSLNGRRERRSSWLIDRDGFTLAENIKQVLTSAHAVEFSAVGEDLSKKKFTMIVKVRKDSPPGGQALRDLALAGLNAGFPFKVSLVKRQRPVYVIRKAGKTPLGLKEITDAKDGVSMNYGKTTRDGKSEWSVEAAQLPMAELASLLEEWLGVPVLDETGLGGARYAFSLKLLSMDVKGAQDGLAALGLKLVEARRAIEIAEVVGTKKEI